MDTDSGREGLHALWMTMEVLADIADLESRCQMWVGLMDVFLNTPLPALNGYTREEYANLTGRNIWELGFDDIETLQLRGERTEVSAVAFVAFRFSPEFQYRIYREFTEIRSDLSELYAILEKPKRCSKVQEADFDWLCYQCLSGMGKVEEGIRLLRKYEFTDSSVALELKKLGASSRKQVNREDDVIVPFRREKPKVGRNDPCPCGSGKKFKKCCMGKGIYD